MIKKALILMALLIVLTVLLTLWIVDKLRTLRGSDSEFSFFSAPPRPLRREPSLPALGLRTLQRSA